MMRYEVKQEVGGPRTSVYNAGGDIGDVVNAVLARLRSTPRIRLPLHPSESQPEPPPNAPAAVVPKLEEVKPKDKNGRPVCARHENRKHELYDEPCLACDMFCNCGASYFSKKYPAVVVRSVDKQLVKLSGSLVASSFVLRLLVGDLDEALKPEMEGGFKTEKVVIKGERNCFSSVLDYRVIGEEEKLNDSGMGSSESESEYSDGSANGARKDTNGAETDIGESCRFEDLVENENDVEKLLILFDTESDRPTLGITKKTLMKVDYYICMHLDEVDERVRAARRKEAFYLNSIYKEAPDLGCVNTFAYEDWEEDFFDIDFFGTFFDLHQANQELLIWDLYMAIEKWMKLNRGFPYGMVNGWYEISEDPTYDEFDKRNVYGYVNVRFQRNYRYRYKIPVRQTKGHEGKLKRQTHDCKKTCVNGNDWSQTEDEGSDNESEGTEAEVAEGGGSEVDGSSNENEGIQAEVAEGGESDVDGSSNENEEVKTAPVPSRIPPAPPVTLKWWIVTAREFD